MTAVQIHLLPTELEKHIKDMEILITTPFHPAYMTKERLQKADKLKLIMTAGVGSDHIDLNTAADKGMTVVEVSGAVLVLPLGTCCKAMSAQPSAAYVVHSLCLWPALY